MKPMAGGWAWAAVLLAAATGCESLQPRSVQIDAASGRYQSAQLTYQLDTGRLSQPVQTARIAGQQVSYQQQPSSPLPDRSLARLSVQYPHPRGKADFALAEVIIESDPRPVKGSSGVDKSSWQRFTSAFSEAMNDILPGMKYGDGVREAWALDIPKSDLDQLVGELANSGYFSYGPETKPGIEVFTRLDGKIIRKTWRQVPALDAFIERVRHEGQLVSYKRPPNSEGQPADAGGGRNDSVAAFQQQQQRQMQQTAPPVQPFPANVDYIAQQAGQPAPQYQGSGAGSMYQGPTSTTPPAYGSPQLPSSGQPQYGLAAPSQNLNGVMPQNALPYGNANSPQYQNANAPQYSNTTTPNYAPGAMPQYGNPPAPQYSSPALNAPIQGAGQTYPNPSSTPAYPQTTYPQTTYPQSQAQQYPTTNAGYSRGY